MKTTGKRACALSGAFVLAAHLAAQGGGTWTPLITQSNGGWANLTGLEQYPQGVRPARAIHMVHLRPTNPTMGRQVGFCFCEKDEPQIKKGFSYQKTAASVRMGPAKFVPIVV